jgi:ammonia channel protein AmtB
VRLRIDDAVGAVSVHGFAGIFGVLVVGVFATGYPNVEGVPPISFVGQFVGLIVCVLCGFIPGYFGSLVLKNLGLLRIPDGAQELGLDECEVPLKAYPEGLKGMPLPAE